uniref:Uncharacterized protein n=1 Tax=Myotis myotis TaxID=51298 RepID=A0A7J7V3M7_MYOMY|nr:hypothetical protein mMyoMyo1_008524 [Myotis myotis]
MKASQLSKSTPTPSQSPAGPAAGVNILCNSHTREAKAQLSKLKLSDCETAKPVLKAQVPILCSVTHVLQRCQNTSPSTPGCSPYIPNQFLCRLRCRERRRRKDGHYCWVTASPWCLLTPLQRPQRPSGPSGTLQSFPMGTPPPPPHSSALLFNSIVCTIFS